MAQLRFLKILTSSEQVFQLEVPCDITISELSEIMMQKTQVPIERQRFFFGGRQIDQESKLSDTIHEDGLTILMSSRLEDQQQQAPPQLEQQAQNLRRSQASNAPNNSQRGNNNPQQDQAPNFGAQINPPRQQQQEFRDIFNIGVPQLQIPQAMFDIQQSVFFQQLNQPNLFQPIPPSQNMFGQQQRQQYPQQNRISVNFRTSTQSTQSTSQLSQSRIAQQMVGNQNPVLPPNQNSNLPPNQNQNLPPRQSQSPNQRLNQNPNQYFSFPPLQIPQMSPNQNSNIPPNQNNNLSPHQNMNMPPMQNLNMPHMQNPIMPPMQNPLMPPMQNLNMPLMQNPNQMPMPNQNSNQPPIQNPNQLLNQIPPQMPNQVPQRIRLNIGMPPPLNQQNPLNSRILDLDPYYLQVEQLNRDLDMMMRQNTMFVSMQNPEAIHMMGDLLSQISFTLQRSVPIIQRTADLMARFQDSTNQEQRRQLNQMFLQTSAILRQINEVTNFHQAFENLEVPQQHRQEQNSNQRPNNRRT